MPASPLRTSRTIARSTTDARERERRESKAKEKESENKETKEKDTQGQGTQDHDRVEAELLLPPESPSVTSPTLVDGLSRAPKKRRAAHAPMGTVFPRVIAVLILLVCVEQ